MDTFAVALVGRLKHGAIVAGLQRKGWRQADLARALHTTATEIGQIVNMRAAPSRQWLTDERIAVFLDLTGQLPEDLWPGWYRTADFLDRDKRIAGVVDMPVQRLLSTPDVRRLVAPGATPEGAAIANELARDLSACLNGIHSKAALVVRLRYGLEDGHEYTIREVADRLGVSLGRASGLERIAMRRLRDRHRLAAWGATK